MKIELPYGRGDLSVEISDSSIQGIYRPSLPVPAEDGVTLVRNAMAAPVASEKLEDLARNCRSAVVIASDHTRPVPSKIIMPQILSALRKYNPDIDITILVATGLHRAPTRTELMDKFGSEIPEREKIIIHDPGDAENLVDIGTLPSGGRVILNRHILSCDLLVAEGFIEPHFFAGFSGGRKSILPGVSAAETIRYNHCAEFIASDFARTGILADNPIHRDMLYAAKLAKLAFIVNVVLNEKKQIVYAVAGDMEKAHRCGCDFLLQHSRITAGRADIVITSNGGYPLDQNLYQAVKGMTAGEALCREGGVIILAAECSDGLGGEEFYRSVANSAPQELLQRILRVSPAETTADQWQFQILVRILCKYKVIVVTDKLDHKLLQDMHLYPASNLNDALTAARRMSCPEPRIAVVPDGVSVIACAAEQS